jgi:hypothetical protein
MSSLNVSSLLSECVMLRDNILQLPHNFLSRDNIVYLIDYLATSSLNKLTVLSVCIAFICAFKLMLLCFLLVYVFVP